MSGLFRRKIKKTIFIVFVNVFVVCLLFLFAEILVRLTEKQIQPLGTDHTLVADSLYFETPGLRPTSSGTSNGAPVFVDTNGFRKTSVPFRPDQKSWLLIGDSVTFGIGVEGDSTFAGILQGQIDSLNVLNPSVIGYAVKDYENVIRYLLGKRPDLNIDHVTVCWCLNDLYEDMPDIEVPGGQLRSAFSDVLLWLRSNSRLFLFLKKTFWDRPKDYFLFDVQFYEPQHPWLLSAVDRLSKICRICEKHDVRFDMVLLPYAYQMHESGHVQPQTLMKTLLDQRNIQSYDILDGMTPSQKNTDYYLFGDGIHFSKRGHVMVARYLISKVVR